ncbi:MAG: PEP-CTERM sorting domain-containing protein [Desulfobacula sp.]|nr:PEP-CTERM sorting domain-containing protein [Desulfobacula sp.]
MKKKCLVFMLSILLLLAFAGVGSANLFLNGDFESSVPSNGTGNSWTSINIDSAGGWRTSLGNPDGNFILNSNGTSSTDPTIEQTVYGMVSGAVYRLNFDVARVYSNYGSNALSFQVYMDDNWLMALFSSTDNEYLNSGTLITAPDTSALFSFRAETVDDSSYRIDNVSLKLYGDNPVPEPATILLFGLGIIGIAGVSRTKDSAKRHF